MTGFPITEATPVSHVAPLPDSADVVVVGGGVIGVCTALFLARLGQKVVLLEKGRIAGEQSSRNWGWIRKQGRDPDELPIMIEANRLWRDLAAEADIDIGLRQTGVLYLARTAREMAGFEGWLPHAHAHDLDSRLLTAREVSGLMPGARGAWLGGLWTASDCRAEPWLAVPALARLAARAGVSMHEACAVRRLDVAAGQVTGVMTEAGRIATSRVVLAAGSWSSLFLRAHGVSIPQLSVRATVAATEPMPQVFDGAATDDLFAFRRRLDGGYTLAPADLTEMFIGPDAFRHLGKYAAQLRANPFGARYYPASPAGFPDAWGTARRWSADQTSPFERTRILNPAPNAKRVARLAREFAATFPDAGPVRIKAAWAGMIDTMPDVVPIIDHVPDLPGLTLATGMSGHGFGIGPGVGRIVADLVMSRDPGHDLHRFRFARFSDGSPLKMGPTL